ncbi:aminoglycoside phosphotransferase family protein [Aquibacillus rhizosphaerae]|uniref:Aminoglycoside phosphotransferase family protein n=1 Tax=Aquibacillus rhizosphaerae TaxID=3051431 RepID=A0ABT7L2X5_9BACI|nr:aminoglycoside phosphotransferase family protein [Aquibacillus sp. LR5S19]MDL4840193.1 aminoglycoside phosphotransferase family protein [Aquibacillus sp. LR5S19]
MELQKKFISNVRLYFKDQGEDWLKKLPNVTDYSKQRWALNILEPYSLSINYVAPAFKDDGTQVVVKMCISEQEFLDELETLKLFNGKGIARLIDFDRENRILLLEKISPGHTLAEVKDDADACRFAANVIRQLVVPAPDETIIQTTKAREKSLRNIMDTHPNGIGPISKTMLEKALSLFTYLHNTPKQRWLLHGDFHHYNIIESGNNTWTAIDPKGLIGEIEYDLIQYLLNKLPEQGANQVIEKRVAIFTKELSLDKERLLLWGYCHTVLATAWTVDDESYNHSFFQGIEIFEKLYKASYGNLLERD